MKTRKFNVIAVATALVLAIGVTTPAVAGGENDRLCYVNNTVVMCKDHGSEINVGGPKGDKGGLDEEGLEIVNNIDNRVTVNEGNIEGNTTDIKNQGDRITVNEGDIKNQGDTLNEHNTRITANETAIKNFNEFNGDVTSFRNDIDANEYGINENRLAIDQLDRDMQSLDRNLSAGIASAIAMGSHQFDPTYKGGQVSISGGIYNQQSAFSLAVGAPIDDIGFFNMSISGNSGSGKNKTALGVGAMFYLPK